MNNKITNLVGNVSAVVFTTLQTNQLFQYISLALTIISVVITICFNLWKWYKNAKADGKITIEETKDLIETVQDGVEDLQDILPKDKEKGGKEDGKE